MKYLVPHNRLMKWSLRTEVALVCALAVLLVASPLLLGAPAAPAKKQPGPNSKTGTEFFENNIRPILINRCYECHSEQEGKQKGGLLLDRASGWLEGGDTGPAVVPRNLKDSLLVTYVEYEDPDFEMPPDEKLPAREINLLKRWIQIGAPGPEKDHGETDFSRLGDQEYLTEKAETHWSFQPVVKPAIPVAKTPEEKGWVKTPVDSFVLAKLDEAELSPSPEADRRTLLRRLSYDLIGLPPTMEEVKAFENDHSENAYQKQVERLLRSPHFGERWARYWLDIARYADTRDFLAAADLRYPFAYTYRDYVIDAFNSDKPYDQFIREQLAADYYFKDPHAPELAALGFLTVGPRFRNNNNELINDRIDVVTRGLMGLTVGCARCHDHKFDPIPTTDFYALQGVFASTEDPESFPVINTGKATDPKEVADYEKQLAAAQKDRADYVAKLKTEATNDVRDNPKAYMDAVYQINVAKSADVRKLITGKKFKETALTPLSQNMANIPKAKGWSAHPVFIPWAELINVPDAKFPAALQAKLKEWEGPDAKVKVNPAILAELKESPPKNRREFLADYGTTFENAMAEWKKAGQPEDPNKAMKPPLNQVAAIMLAETGPFHFSEDRVEGASRLLGAGRNALQKLDVAIQDVEASHPGAPARAMVLADKENPVNSPVFERGDPKRRGEVVPRRFLTIFNGPEKPFTEGSGRRELAEAIARPDNQFTTRVMADRVWRHLMGSALIAGSPGDLGLQTPEPVEPELLDWLAASFVENDWSVKALIRTIVNSSTYRQQSTNRAEAAEADPENSLYWRANRERLDFEAMRDAMLSASGNLDPKFGGRPVDISAQPFSVRRTVYSYIDRVNLDDVFSTFDFPSPDQTSPERPETMVPQQALYSMNDPFTIDQARSLVKSKEFNAIEAPEKRVDFIYDRFFQRQPTDRERQLAVQFVNNAVDSVASPVAGPWYYGYGPADPDKAAGERFRRLPYWNPQGKRYQGGRAYPNSEVGHANLNATGGHPGRNNDQGTVLRWRAPYDASIIIRGELEHASENGDGVRATILASRGGVLGEWDAHHSKTETLVKQYNVGAGEVIDFIVTPGDSPTSDAYRWAPVIKLRGPAEEMPVGVQTVWSLQSDFSPPPPPPLKPWEQVAHAMMMTNEFLFVD